ncbi:tetratricopeptide repeat protein [Archangium gephyra]|uniref:tetratricopeptide repeat protein n=1 Tax=Archangium gephyra TaxID=48 RepID=UPI0035D463DA
MAAGRDSKRGVDVVILTAISLEYQAVLQVDAGAVVASGWQEEQGPNGLPVAFQSFQSQGSRPLRVAVALAGDMGAVAATNALLPLVETLSPRCVAMAGVCAGRPGKTNLGDVVAAERLFFHDTGKRLPDEVLQDLKTYNLRDDWKLALEHFDFAARFREQAWWQRRPMPYEWQENWVLAKLREGVTDPSALPELNDFCPQWEKVIESLWKSGRIQDGTLTLTEEGRAHIGRILIKHRNRLPDLTPSGPLQPFKVHVAPMGSGNQVIEDERAWSFVSAHMRKTLGLEMEAAALGALVHAQRERKLDALVMKGVMDFANDGRDDHFKEYAARASAECLLAFLREHVEVEVVPGTDDLLVPGTEPLPANPPPSTLLNARYEVVPFHEQGREEILAELDRWCDEGPPVAVRLLHAEGGVGKTRLAIEWSRRRSARGWATGFLAKDVPEDWFERLWARGQPVLVVIDYAESRSELRAALQRMLRYSQQEGTGTLRRMRLLLLARNSGDWWQSLRQSDAALDLWLGETPPQELLPLAMETAERERIFHEAAERFAGQRGRPYEQMPVPIPLSDARFVRVLYLHMAALASVEGLAFEANTLMEVVLDHEERFWDTRVRQSDVALSFQRSLARQVVAAATLRGGLVDASTATRVMKRLLEREPNSQEEELQRLLHRIYQHTGREASPYLPSLEPDLLGEGMVLRVASPRTEEDRLGADWIERVLPADEEARVVVIGLEVLGRASSARPEVVRPWLERLLAGPLRSRARLALEAAKAVSLRTASSMLGDVLADRLEVDGDAALAEELNTVGVPNSSVSLGRVSEWTTRTLLRAPPSPELERTTDRRARLIFNQGNQLYQRGRYRDALALLNDSIERYRVLVRHTPAMRPRFANCFEIQGLVLKNLGRHDEALSATREALGIYRELDKRRPSAFRSEIAGLLNNLGIILVDAKRFAQAVEPLEQAIGLFRSLAQEHPGSFRSPLAGALDNLGNSLTFLDRDEDAWKVTDEAVRLYRVLTQLNPDALLPRLAGALDNLGTRLNALGRHAEALEATRESVAHYRVLVKHNPDAFQMDLAASLTNLSIRWRNLRRREEALEAVREAVGLYRAAFPHNPDAVRPHLFTALHFLGKQASATDRNEEALKALEESLAPGRILAKRDPATFQPELAESLMLQGRVSNALGRPEAALEAMREAAALSRDVAKRDPGAGRQKHVVILYELGWHLDELGRSEELQHVTCEVIPLYRVLLQQDPSAFQPDLARGLLELGSKLNGFGRPQDALSAASERVALCRVLEQRDPKAFGPTLAIALDHLGLWLSTLGRSAEAVKHAREAVERYRALGPLEPALQMDLANSLNNLGIHLNQVGKPQEAVESTHQAIELLRALDEHGFEAVPPAIARGFYTLARALNGLDRNAEALKAAREAVKRFSALVRNHPEAARLMIAENLLDFSELLDDLVRPEDALAMTRHAVELYRLLVPGNPDRFRPDLINGLTFLSTRLALLGQHRAALPLLREQRELYLGLKPQAFKRNAPAYASCLCNLSKCLLELCTGAEAFALANESVELMWPFFKSQPELYGTETGVMLRHLRMIYEEADQPMPAVLQERIKRYERIVGAPLSIRR